MDLSIATKNVEADPNNPELRLELGLALMEAGRANDAIDHLRKAMTLKKDHLAAYLALGRALLQEGEHIPAIATLEGGREIARKLQMEPEVAAFDAALEGLGPPKRRAAAPLDDAAFRDLARKTLAQVGSRIADRGLDVRMHATPSVLILETCGSKLGLSEQPTSREIWCTSALGKFKFRYIPGGNYWKNADGAELLATVSAFLTRSLGGKVQL